MPDQASDAAPRIRTTVEDHVLVIEVDRPEKRNAFDMQALREFSAAYTRLDTDDDLWAGCVVSTGDHFSAGLDLADVAPVVAEQGPSALAGAGEVDPWGIWGRACSKPVVVALNGLSYTLSIELALAADIVVCADDVRLRQMEIARGIIPFGGATFRAPDRLGWANAMRWILTGEEFGADEALRIGLCSEVVPAGEHVARAKALAHLVAAQAPLGVHGTLANARIGRERGQEAAAEHLVELLPTIMRSADAAEGVASFVERREARFTGR
ncbi:MAG: crotonase/enoyl-CoA hydratase family protein [Actinomycetes bacterium]